MGRRAARRTIAIFACSCAALPASGHAAQTARLQATLTPERLGQGTTIGFNLQIASPTALVPSPMTGFELRYPANLGLELSGLGVATCNATALELFGPAACPANSRMGRGVALAEIPIGPEVIHETAPITLVRGSTPGRGLVVLAYVNAEVPVWAPLTLPGRLLPAPAPYGGRIYIHVPLVPSVPGGPDAAVVEVRATFGPLGLTYYDSRRGRRVPYRPRGILLPDNCPRGGFPFAAILTFLDGSQTRAQSAVACP